MSAGFRRKPLLGADGRPYRDWLLGGSLTHRLRGLCPDFRVTVMAEGAAPAAVDEAAWIGLSRRRHAMTREVFLHCGPIPVVFARSVFPAAGLRGPWRFLRGLGHRPLGEELFKRPGIGRRVIGVAGLRPGHSLYGKAWGAAPGPARLWARRSLFVSKGVPLLLTEVFLPAVLEVAR